MRTTLILLFLAQSQPAPSFLDQSIVSAKEKIGKEPVRAEGYNELASALTRKERETGDASLLVQAETAIEKSLKIAPANFEARKARVAIRLRERRFEDALEEAQALNKQTPDDNAIYGFISEAQLAIGNYTAAENAVQTMLNLRQVNGPGHERGAMVREFIGYPEGAVDWWNSALHLSSDRDTEERSYIYSQLTRVYRETGKYESALESARRALTLVPNHPVAQHELARVYIDQGKGQQAAAILRTLQGETSTIENEYFLAQALDLSGDAGSTSVWSDFVKRARSAVASPANGNALLVRYLADHGKSAEAVIIGEQALTRRRDIFMLNAYAWALWRAGRNVSAFDAVSKALEPGMRNAPLYFDAGTIAKAANQNAKALEYFKTSFEINPNSLAAVETLKQLAALTASSN